MLISVWVLHFLSFRQGKTTFRNYMCNTCTIYVWVYTESDSMYSASSSIPSDAAQVIHVCLTLGARTVNKAQFYISKSFGVYLTAPFSPCCTWLSQIALGGISVTTSKFQIAWEKLLRRFDNPKHKLSNQNSIFLSCLEFILLRLFLHDLTYIQ